MPDAEDELVSRAQQGDRAALDMLLVHHLNDWHKICIRIVGATDAEDALQEACIRIVRGIEGFESNAKFATWTHSIVCNTCMEHCRKTSRARGLQLAAAGEHEPSHPPDDPGNDLVFRENLAAALEAIKSLPPDQRDCLVFHFFRGMTHSEIATSLNIPHGTVKSHLRRGLQKVRRLIEDRDDGGNRHDK